MIQLRLVLFGVTVIASVGYAIYRHYKERPQQQQHCYGQRSYDEFPANNDNTGQSTSKSSETDVIRRRRKSSTSTHCTICLVDLLSTATNSKTLSCGHFFHDNCIGTWFNTKQKTCPICRALV